MFPTIGIGLFVGLYIYSTLLYPGGSQADQFTEGFDWLNNYWCNLLNEQAINGQPNPARPIAISAMAILCLGLVAFFVQFSKTIAKGAFWKIAIPVFGAISMVLAFLISTKYHDLMTTLSSIFGSLVVVGIIWEMHNSAIRTFKISGALCILLLGINNYIYYSNQWIEHLPLIQKLTFLTVLSWVIALNFKLTNYRPTFTGTE